MNELVRRHPSPPRPVPLSGFFRAIGARAIAVFGGIALVSSAAAVRVLTNGPASAAFFGWFCVVCAVGAVVFCFVPYTGLRGVIRNGEECEAVVTAVRHEQGRLPVADGRARLVEAPDQRERIFRCSSEWARKLRPGSRIRVLAQPDGSSKLHALGPSEPKA